VLARLSEAPELSVTTLAKPFAMSLPAVLKHLDVLEVAGLIRRRKSGRTVSCRLDAAPLQEAQRWLAHYERFWSDRLDALARYLAEEAAPDAAAEAKPDATTNPTPNVEPIPCPPTLNPPLPRAQARPTITRASASPSAASRLDDPRLEALVRPGQYQRLLAERITRVVDATAW
jgi:hypothetical protein